MAEVSSITCPQCGMTSYHPDDIRYGYCGGCHAFTGAIERWPALKASQEENKRLQAMADVLLVVAKLYVDAFDPEELMTLPERLMLQRVEDILGDPASWSPDKPIGGEG